ncbi:MAG: hypothetical protein JOZ57_10030 [Abitibacteriaceae bacterium]|nr:hypothetical protein [Abditibacteriaceae bacterium]
MLLKSADPGTRIVLTVSDADEKLSYLSGLKGAGFGVAEELQDVDPGTAPNPNQNLVRPLGAMHEMVPTRWIGLDGVDLVVLQDFPHTALRPEQLTALRGYVAAGGSILIFGGADWQRLAKSPLADLWPVNPASWSVAIPAEMNTLVQRYVTASPLTGADRLGGAPVTLTRGTLQPGAHLLTGSAAAPLLASIGVGAGQVIFFAGDATKPPFIGWSGDPSLWADIFNVSVRPHRIESIDPNASMPIDSSYGSVPSYSRGYYNGSNADNQDNNPLMNLLQQMDTAQQLKTPPVSYIAWFLALCVFFLVPVNYCILRYFDKRELAWVTVPVIVLAFSVISYAAALSIKGHTVLTRHINIVQGASDSGTARADTMLWLFSPRKTTYNITSTDPQTIIADYINNEDTSRVTIREPDETAFTVENAAINMWDRRSFVGQAVIKVGKGVHVGIRGGQPSVQNNTPFDLRGTVLVTGGQVRAYGDLKAGASAAKLVSSDKVDLADPSLIGRILQASHLDAIFPATATSTPQNMATAALPIALGQDFGKSGNPGALLIAWSNQPANALNVENETPQAQNITLYVFRLSDESLLALPSPGANASGKGGTVAGLGAVIRPVGVESADANPDSGSGSLLTYNCQLPRAAGAQVGAESNPWRSLSIVAHGRNVDYNSNSSYYYNNRRWNPRRRRYEIVPRPNPMHTRSQTAVQFEIWNFAKSQWQSLGGSSGQSWVFKQNIPNVGNLIRQPDNLVRLRARTAHSGVKVDAVRVQAQPNFPGH